ncbi:MAG: hypothetical protein M1817_004157 [Caeruleum heppii]|nr:MAG: hypothetical protein M1817_004157 [Caeruleum heppii]
MAAAMSPSSSMANPPAIRRAFTLPSRLADSARIDDGRTRVADGVDILFSHDSGRVVAFCPVPNTPRPGSSDGRRGSEVVLDSIGTLPWASRTERIIATGPLQIYTAHAVAFLSAGSVVHPIFATSQSWCVDGQSKIVLRIRDNFYYRIELPNDTDEHLKLVENLKEVLAKVLRYEKTPCPFKRGFTVELPEEPVTPKRIRPWKPRERPKAAELEPVREPERADEYITAPSDDGDASESGSKDGIVEDTNLTPRASMSRPIRVDSTMTPTRPKGLAAARSITAPPHLTLGGSSTSMTPPVAEAKVGLAAASLHSSSVDSFRSYQTAVSLFPPSPPESFTSSPPPSTRSEDDDTVMAAKTVDDDGGEGISPTQTMAPGPRFGSDDDGQGSTTSSSSSATGGSSSPSSGFITPSHGIALRKRRAPTQAASSVQTTETFYPPPSPGHHVTTAIIQKSCSIMLGTPAELIELMLGIARRILNGALRGVVIGYGERGEKIPGSWESSDGDDTGDDSWDEDDYGILLNRIPSHGGPADGRGS